MNDKSSPPKPWRRALFLLPALLAAALIFYTLLRTQPVLAAVPDLLEYEPTPTPAPTEKVDRSAQREEAEAKHTDPTAGRRATVASFTAPAAVQEREQEIALAEAHNREVQQKMNAVSERFVPGTYEGEAQGFGGIIRVSVTVDEHEITDIQVLSSAGEDAAYFSQAESLNAKILLKQSTDLDAVTGATLSSIGLLDAVDAALSQAVK